MWTAGVAIGLAAAFLAAGTAHAQEPQEPKRGAFVDGEFVEFYEYAADFMSPEELKRHIDARSDRVVILDTAAPLIFEEEHISGAVNFPWVQTLATPVTLPRDKTLVLYCACKNHEDSIDMAKKLSLAGYLDVKVLRGGWFTWLDLKYPLAGASKDGDGR
jgi:rhodanese-related sulfurtransferase